MSISKLSSSSELTRFAFSARLRSRLFRDCSDFAFSARLRSRLFRLMVTGVIVAVPSTALADLGSGDMPGTAQPNEENPDEFLVEVRSASNNLPILVVVGENESDVELATQVRREIELTGVFSCPVAVAGSVPLPVDRKRWPRAATAVVVISRQRRTDSSFSMLSAKSFHRSQPDEIRHRELTEYPSLGALNAATLADAILEDVIGVRGHMSGQLTFTDASNRGERTVRVMGPDGLRGRRISGFGILARGSDFGPNGVVDYAAEDRSGKLSLFREGSTTAIPLASSGYLQSVSYSPNGLHAVESIGKGNEVETWAGASLQSLNILAVSAGYSSLSPSIDDEGQVLHAVGPAKGPFSVHLGSRSVTPSGVWAAMPSFCSTAIEKRIVYMVRSGSHWDIRITSLVNGSTRTVVMGGMSPTCSPDGRTVAFYAPGKGRQGEGIYLAGDEGGSARKVWDGQAASLRWRGGERLPPRQVERVVAEAPAAADSDDISADPGTIAPSDEKVE